MTADTANIIAVGKPQNDAEIEAIAYLRDHLSSEYTIIHNFEVQQGKERFEVDLAVIAPHAIYLVDVKGVRGKVSSDGSYWYPEGRMTYHSPVKKIAMNARSFKSFIKDKRPDLSELERIWVEGLVLLTSPDVEFRDSRSRQGQENSCPAPDTEEWSVVKLEDSIKLFTDPKRVPDRFLSSIAKFRNSIRNTIKSEVKEPISQLIFNDWIVVQDPIFTFENRTDYRAYNKIAGIKAGTVRLQVYKADPYLSVKKRNEQQEIIKVAYKALEKLPHHPNIVNVRDLFSVEEGEKYVLVLEDIHGTSLKQHEDDLTRPLTLDQKLGITTDLLSALVHAHTHKVVHRNITPRSLWLTEDGVLKLDGFDYAHIDEASSFSFGENLPKYLDEIYCAPEVRINPIKLGPSSDLFSAGIVLYELFSGKVPFHSYNEMVSEHSVFPEPVSICCPGLPHGVDEWLASLCQYNPDERPDTNTAFETWKNLVKPSSSEQPVADPITDYNKIPPETVFLTKYRIMEHLGKPGAFGVVYRAFDTFANQDRAIKFVVRDHCSTLDRLKQEYRSLINIPEHPRIVKIYDANLTPDNTPYLVFQYLEGHDLAHLIAETPFSPDKVLILAKQVTDGLIHLHKSGKFHCDIKPSNILWTQNGAVLIDFNVSMSLDLDGGLGGGTRRYLPPDFDSTVTPDVRINTDRDLYALGITLYQALVGGRGYPWETEVPPPDIPPRDPAIILNRSDLSPRFVKVLTQLIAPRRVDRFATVTDLSNELASISSALQQIEPADPKILTSGCTGANDKNNCNIFVDTLVSFYSKSITSNAGTRGLDTDAKIVYIPTALDKQLLPAVMRGEYNLVIISGNAGDGKTAFLQQIEDQAKAQMPIDYSSPLGVAFIVDTRQYLINYDGSEDKGELDNEEVLVQFFAPFKGRDSSAWPKNLVRMIAINEGRLRDFLTKNEERFPALKERVDTGFLTGREQDGVFVINLNIRSVVAHGVGENTESIFTQLIKKMVAVKNWTACSCCDLADRCYIHHNVLTLSDTTAGSQVIHRLETLYALTHLRDTYHITLRDLRSALSYLITSNRTCQMIHQLYASDKTEEILDSYYYVSWMGGHRGSSDRLLSRLAMVDMGLTPDAELDRSIEFRPIGSDQNLFSFDRRSDYELKILTKFQQELPWDPISSAEGDRLNRHRHFLEFAKRRTYFEQQGDQWEKLLPYRYGTELLSLITEKSEEKLEHSLNSLITAITRGEKGPIQKEHPDLVLQVTPTSKGSIRSYRVFPFNHFSLDYLDPGLEASYIEHTPTGLRLNYQRITDDIPYTLEIKLDIYEMLKRLNEGYTPTVEQRQGFALQLDVFKNLLASAPYQELLITKTGHDFYRIQRMNEGQLRLSSMKEICS